MGIFRDYTFVNELAEHLIESTRIPKVQVERFAGPILTIFIEKLISSVVDRPVRLLTPEFPLKKEGTHQSTNVDWLMMDHQQGTLFLVELKTDADSENRSQLETYTAVKERVARESARFLMDDLHSISSHAGTKETKYRYLIDQRIGSASAAFPQIRTARIIYIVPNALKSEELARHADRIITLSELSDRYGSIASKEWEIIADALKQIDNTIHYVHRASVPVPAAKERSFPSVAAVIMQRHRSPEGLQPELLWIGRSGGTVGPRPNYQVRYTNGTIVPYRFSGKVFEGVERFNHSKLTDAIPWERIK